MALSKVKAFKWLSLSDIHFGSRVTTTEELVEELDVFFDRFSDSGLMTKLDMISFGGDIWDNALMLSSDSPAIAIPFFFRLFAWASAHDISIRLLEGTPKHDRRQTETMMRIADRFKGSLDVKYVATLSIEHHEKTGFDILYVPDECRPTAEETARDVQKLLDEAGLKQVDIAIMHGMFKYQLGSIPMNSKVHDEEWYLQIVKYYITIGHVHTASQYGRILAQGSFGRLSHGQEEAKGAFWIERDEDDHWSHQFLENKLAKSYTSVRVRGTIEETFEQLDKLTRKLRAGSQFQLDIPSGHPLLNGFSELSRRYPGFGFVRKKEKIAKKESVLETPIDYRAIVLNENTIVQSILAEIDGRAPLDEIDRNRLQALLEGL